MGILFISVSLWYELKVMKKSTTKNSASTETPYRRALNYDTNDGQKGPNSFYYNKTRYEITTYLRFVIIVNINIYFEIKELKKYY